MKAEIRFEVEIAKPDDAEHAYDLAFGALAEVFGSESVKGDDPRIEGGDDETGIGPAW